MPLIGNQRNFAFEVVPVSPSWAIRYAPEKAAWTGIAIWVNGKNLCRNIVPGSSEVHEYLFVPAAPLADWIVRSFPALEFEERAPHYPTNRSLHESVGRWGDSPPPGDLSDESWVQEREDWWARHFLKAGADGARLPNLAFVRDDEQLVLNWAPTRFVSSDAPDLIEVEGAHSLPWILGAAVLRDFVTAVARSLREASLEGLYPWVHPRDPLAALQISVEARLELYTGRDLTRLADVLGPHRVDSIVQTLTRNGRDPAAIPECQVLRDLSPSVNSEVGGILALVGELVSRQDQDGLRRLSSSRQLAADASRPAENLVEAGYMAAGELRHELGFDGRAVRKIEDVLTQLGVSYEHLEVDGEHEPMIVAFLDGGSAVARTLATARTSTRWGRRFEATRALGHALMDPLRAHALGAATGPFAQESRRRRSGAFAAEFLLPEPALQEASGGRLDGAATDDVFSRLMEQHGVGARTAANHLWNRGWLSSPDVRDDLIERFAAQKE